MERRLTTILAADMVGYIRLLGEDEAGTLAALAPQACQSDKQALLSHAISGETN